MKTKRPIGRKLKVSFALLGLLASAIAILVLWPSSLPPEPDAETSRLIRNVRIIDTQNGTASAPQSILVRDGMIEAIGVDLDNGGLPVYDAGGAFALPGFWDMHVHTFQLSPQLHLPLWVANGVLNTRDMMDCPEESDSLVACHDDKQAWNDAVSTGRLAAPRIVQVASFYLERPDMTAGEARRLVQRYDARGLDAIKIYNGLRPDAFAAAADEAQARKLKLVGHLPKAVSLEEAIAAGQTSFEHAHIFARHCFAGAEDWREGRLDDLPAVALAERIVTTHDDDRCADAMQQMAEAQAWFVPTHVTREEDARAADPDFLEDPVLDYLDPLSRWAWNDDRSATRDTFQGRRGRNALSSYFDMGLDLTGKAHDRGVPVLVGTDSPLGGFRYHDEMAHLVRAGLSPAEVLKAATIDAARYAGEQDTAGTIEPGKRADFILLTANPLDSIANTKRIDAVVQSGRLYDRARLDALLAFTRGQAGAPHNWAKLIWGFLWSSVSSEL